MSEEAPQRVARWLAEARRLGASDLHLEPGRARWRLRARVDGVLRELEGLSPAEGERALARIKVISGLLTYRTAQPQDGRVRDEHAPDGLEIRAATYPTIHGERALLRLLARETSRQTLAQLGLSPASEAGLRRYVGRPEGALLVTGPAGAGKTTTLYAVLRELAADPGRHLVTIEDPVELELDGVTQTEVDAERGLGFPAALRGLLRHDPDGLLIGEVRDEVTALIAIRAALSGHAVLGTLHAGDAVGVYLRLLQMGVPAHLLAPAIEAVCAQRLLRAACRCDGPPADCPRCRATGYRGRRAVEELLLPDEPFRAALLAPQLSRADLTAAALAAGLVPMPERARQLVGAGETTQAELDRVFGA